MAKTLADMNLAKLSGAVREARRNKGWTLEQLSYELRARGFPTAQNKLWRLENQPPRRIDTELLLWLEKVLEVELIESAHKNQVLIEDVLDLLDGFIDTEADGSLPRTPGSTALQPIYQKIVTLSRAALV